MLFIYGHPDKMFRFPSPDQKKNKTNSRFISQRSKYFNLQAHDLVLLTTIGMMLCPVSLINIDTMFLRAV